ncbi:MAG: serine/threonine-protein kinase [Pirellulales bacterium]
MEQTTRSVLQRTALASRLVSPMQLEETLGEILRELPGRMPSDQVPDELLGERLLVRGYLNRWQMEQLQAGRTKFTLGPYRIVDAIGRGGMGHVFKGVHELLGRVEAIKVLPRQKSTPESVASFLREIRAQAQLDHPNLVRVLYADCDGDTHFFVTEYVPGIDLRRMVRRLGALPVGAAATALMQTAHGLEYAHRKGLVHRDVKPGNLLVRPDGEVKVIDLGLAWYLEDSVMHAVGDGRQRVVGTADYLAPEAIASPKRIMPVSDVYSLGCTLYYAVTGKVPFPGGNTAEKMQRHLTEAPRDPRQFAPGLPTEMVKLLLHMLEKDPAKRLPAAATVAQRLAPWATEAGRRELAELALAGERSLQSRGHSVRAHATGLEDTVTADREEDISDEEATSTGGEILSQASQGTDPAERAAEETLTEAPMLPMEPSRVDVVSRWIALVAAIATVAILAVIVWKQL